MPDLYLALLSRLLLLSVDSFSSQLVTILVWSFVEFGTRTAGPLFLLSLWLAVLPDDSRRDDKMAAAEENRTSAFVAQRIYLRSMSELASIPIAVGIVLLFRVLLEVNEDEGGSPSTGALVLSLLVQLVAECATDLIATTSMERLLQRSALQHWALLGRRTLFFGTCALVASCSVVLVELAVLVGMFHRV